MQEAMGEGPFGEAAVLLAMAQSCRRSLRGSGGAAVVSLRCDTGCVWSGRLKID